MSREGDVVLIHYQDKPAIFARIESIEPDVKKDWYQVTLLLLSLPTQTVTWILRKSYINGSPFTMGGRPVRLEEVKKAQIDERNPNARHQLGVKDVRSTPSKIIPFKRP